jgi:hypothetical protein
MDADSSDENPTTGTSIVKKKRAEVMLAKDADEGNNTASDIHRLVRIPNAFLCFICNLPQCSGSVVNFVNCFKTKRPVVDQERWLPEGVPSDIVEVAELPAE